MNLPVLILAGGASRRMGRDKAGLMLDGVTLADRAAARLAGMASPLLLSAGPHSCQTDGTITLSDRITGFQGPLAGIHSGLSWLLEQGHAASHMLSIAVDTPFFPENLATAFLAENPASDEIILAASDGRQHPVFALWPLSLTHMLEQFLLVPGNRRVMAFIAAHRHRAVAFSEIETPLGVIDPFFNINTEADLATAARFAPYFSKM
ncbi:molybdenum cofactor guanylyltransferase [Martelella alba]|uniref:Molybdenum cofactor guanylyltransferase n=1 Tax=Martelella alba TaxID=2590451 RepID=A0A506U3U7_9HYPH|nr:molybdenum cofactor guanylyltransferase MobA [Martelella alba]TPW28006.1 molybdenum cofactor guanylyltransferase [Martelella alba]